MNNYEKYLREQLEKHEQEKQMQIYLNLNCIKRINILKHWINETSQQSVKTVLQYSLNNVSKYQSSIIRYINQIIYSQNSFQSELNMYLLTHYYIKE